MYVVNLVCVCKSKRESVCVGGGKFVCERENECVLVIKAFVCKRECVRGRERETYITSSFFAVRVNHSSRDRRRSF